MSDLWIAPQPLVLASKSRSRQALLTAAGVAFVAAPADLDERVVEREMRGADAARVAAHLARAKALAIAARYPGRLVLGADQTLGVDGEILSKPETLPAAAAQLARLSGRAHDLHSAICLARDGEVAFETAPQARMTMRRLTPEFIACYCSAAGATILESVGAYQLEGFGIHLFERLEGDHSTILGLPLIPLLAFLRAQGYVAS
jgi:septum formation protein